MARWAKVIRSAIGRVDACGSQVNGSGLPCGKARHRGMRACCCSGDGQCTLQEVGSFDRSSRWRRRMNGVVGCGSEVNLACLLGIRWTGRFSHRPAAALTLWRKSTAPGQRRHSLPQLCCRRATLQQQSLCRLHEEGVRPLRSVYQPRRLHLCVSPNLQPPASACLPYTPLRLPLMCSSSSIFRCLRTSGLCKRSNFYSPSKNTPTPPTHARALAADDQCFGVGWSTGHSPRPSLSCDARMQVAVRHERCRPTPKRGRCWIFSTALAGVCDSCPWHADHPHLHAAFARYCTLQR